MFRSIGSRSSLLDRVFREDRLGLGKRLGDSLLDRRVALGDIDQRPLEDVLVFDIGPGRGVVMPLRLRRPIEALLDHCLNVRQEILRTALGPPGIGLERLCVNRHEAADAALGKLVVDSGCMINLEKSFATARFFAPFGITAKPTPKNPGITLPSLSSGRGWVMTLFSPSTSVDTIAISVDSVPSKSTTHSLEWNALLSSASFQLIELGGL